MNLQDQYCPCMDLLTSGFWLQPGSHLTVLKLMQDDVEVIRKKEWKREASLEAQYSNQQYESIAISYVV